MKKSKLSLGLVTSFIAAMGLSACGSTVTKDKSNLVEFTGANDTSMSISIDEIYDDYKKSSDGIAKYYDQVMEVLIRNAFQKDPKGTEGLKGIKKNYNRIVSEAKDNVEGSKKTARGNAKTNGTSYQTEWQSILSSKNVKDEEELLQTYIYELEKEEIEDWFYEQHKDELKREYLGVKTDGTAAESKVSSRFPYHVRHILVKVEDGASDYTRGTVTASQATLLSEVIQRLARGDNFGTVAKEKSEDSSSSSYGDVGLMTNAITNGSLGMVNEFQLGIYAYDAIINHKGDKANSVISEALALNKSAQKGSDESVATYFTAKGIAEIPYSVAVELGEVANLEANKETGLQVEDGKAAIYPRNLLWNRFFNNHSIFVITNGSRPSVALTGETLDPTSSSSYYTGEDAYESIETGEKIINYGLLPGFKANDNFSGTDRENEKVLSDESGNVIIGVRSQFGIHLMVVQKSVYEFSAGPNDVSLEDYYTSFKPGEAGYPTYGTGEDVKEELRGKEKNTYVNFIYSTNPSDYNTRIDTVKSAIKGFDKTYDYRLYESLTTNRDTDFSGDETKELLGLIDNYIAVQRNKNVEEQVDGMESVWQTYIELLEVQHTYRQTLKRALPEGCKINFSNKYGTAHDKEQYEQGGACYVK